MRNRNALLLPLLLISAAPPSREDALTRALAATKQNNSSQTEFLFQSAARETNDPGLVAFNHGVWLLNKGDFRTAELELQRCLDDKTIPQTRRANAMFILGCAQLNRGGSSGVYRSAIRTFESCLKSTDLDLALKRKAEHNLEIAKVLWLKSLPKDKNIETPNTTSPETPSPKPMATAQSATETTQQEKVNNTAKATAANEAVPNTTPTSTNQKTPGVGNAPVLADTNTLQQLTPEDTSAKLKAVATRLEKDRRDTARLVAGPDRKTVRDW